VVHPWDLCRPRAQNGHSTGINKDDRIQTMRLIGSPTLKKSVNW
jgi:hypothetical protein